MTGGTSGDGRNDPTGRPPTFADFRAAVQDVMDRVPTTPAAKLASPMTRHVQEFDDASFLAA